MMRVHDLCCFLVLTFGLQSLVEARKTCHHSAAFLCRPHSHFSHGVSSRGLLTRVFSTSKNVELGKQAAGEAQSTQHEQRSGYEPTVELIHEPTGCTVVLLGCLHGSASSANDVEHAILGHEGQATQTTTTDAVVLELCAGRYAALRRTMTSNIEKPLFNGAVAQEEEEQQQTSAKNDSSKNSNSNSMSSRASFLTLISRISEKKGLSTGVAATLLGGVAGMQATLSGLQPGLEFKRAIECVQTTTTSTSNNQENECYIFLADRAVEETLRRVGDVPQLAWSFLIQSALLQWDTSNIIQGLQDLRLAFGGGSFTTEKDPKHQPLNVGGVLLGGGKDNPIRKDVAMSTLPPLAAFAIMGTLVDAALNALFFGSAEDLGVVELDVHMDWTMQILSILGDVLTVGGMVAMFFMILAPPVCKVIVSERDDQLAKGVEDACFLVRRQRLAASAKVGEEGEEVDAGGDGGRVVAVLGLIHVNGVAKRLLMRNKAS